MRLICGLVLAAAVVGAPAFAGDKDKPKVVEVKKDADKVTEAKYKVKVEKSGNKFTRFWTDDVGNTIYKGLKKGSNKIANTFD